MIWTFGEPCISAMQRKSTPSNQEEDRGSALGKRKDVVYFEYSSCVIINGNDERFLKTS